RRDGDALLIVDLLGRRLLDVRRRQLHLDDVRAQLAGDLRRVGDDVDRGLALLGEPGAARVRPHHHREPLLLGLLAERADLLVHRVAQVRPRVDREADGGTAEPERVVDAARDRRTRLAVPAGRPWFSGRAGLLRVPGQSRPYQPRISWTRSFMSTLPLFAVGYARPQRPSPQPGLPHPPPSPRTP